MYMEKEGMVQQIVTISMIGVVVEAVVQVVLLVGVIVVVQVVTHKYTVDSLVVAVVLLINVVDMGEVVQ